MKPTAIGRYLVVHPCYSGSSYWYVTSCNSVGNWQASVRCESKAAAVKKRLEIRRHHAKLAAEIAARAAKRKKHGKEEKSKAEAPAPDAD